MANIKRHSPVSLKGTPVQTETRGHWTLVLEYTGEGKGPYLIDLCHRPRWDVQDSKLDQVKPWGLTIPQAAGECSFQQGMLINRMNRTQASLWNLAGRDVAEPQESAYTETTDATLFLALIGRQVFAIAEKLTALDFLDPAKKTPCLIQGPVSHVPCQVVMLNKNEEHPGILLTCSRGYARDMVESIVKAGEEFGLRSAGEKTFSNWLQQLAL